jgi:trans-2,3-dihydro-3-hydroxyanthranilate isomerase
MRQFSYETVDVFTDQPLAGNPLAVFADGRGLGADEMQRIATEFNYSEITFVLPPSDRANSAQVRIFTPKSELPFAGHPNVGTAFVLGRRGQVFDRPLAETMRFEEGAGLVELKLQRDGEAVVGASFKVPRAIELGREIDPETIALCTSLKPQDIVVTHHKPVFASVGLPFAITEVASLDALKRARPNSAEFSQALARSGGLPERFSVFIYARLSGSTEKLRARMFAPLSNIIEDPATGSASAALGGLLCTLDKSRDADMRFSIAQGVEMGRPSAIEVSARKEGGTVRDIFVAGRCVPVMRGMLTLPS